MEGKTRIGLVEGTIKLKERPIMQQTEMNSDLEADSKKNENICLKKEGKRVVVDST